MAILGLAVIVGNGSRGKYSLYQEDSSVVGIIPKEESNEISDSLTYLEN